MHNLIKLLKVLLLSFIIMTGTGGSDAPRPSSRLTTKDDGTVQNQGTETEQFDAIEAAARQAALTAETALPVETMEEDQ